MADFDYLFVGAGHNALVCAAYLARAGYQVGVFERRHRVGGAVVTEEHIPGFRFDLGGSAHILIHHTPIVRDLELEKFGLEYIDIDPLFFAPFPDDSHLFLWKDVDRTCESIAAVCEEDAVAYRRFVDEWRPMAESMVESFLHAPSPLNVARYLAFESGAARAPHRRLPTILGGYGPFLRKTFKSPKVQSLIGWMAAQSGPPPDEKMSAPFALWHPLYHQSGMKRPRGGSGMLTQALAAVIRAYGGTIETDAPVNQILVEGGRAVGLETIEGRRASARLGVVSGAHIHTTLDLLKGAGGSRARRARQARIGNGFGMIVRFALDGLPQYRAYPTGSPGPQHRAMQFICPDLDYLDRAYNDYANGNPSREPALIAMTFSAVDPSLAPPDHHVLFLWGQYYPYELRSGASWDDIGDNVADQMLATLETYAPGIADKVIGRLVETPLYLERELGLLRGNVMHLEMSVNQMFTLRPAWNLSQYRGPVDGLYLTGASTHPGGGIMGASGRNAAAAILKDQG